MKTARSLLLVTCALGAAAPAAGQPARTVAAAPMLVHRSLSPTAKIAVWRGQETATAYLTVTVSPSWREPPQAGETIAYDIDIANNGPGQAVLVGLAQTTSNLAVQPLAGACQPLPCEIGYGDGRAIIRLLPTGDHAIFHVTATIAAAGPFGGAVAVQTRSPKDERSQLQATFAGTAARPPSPPPPPPSATAASGADLGVTADLTPAGPYRSGEKVLLVVDVTNLGGRGVRGLRIANRASNLEVEPLWGGCEAAPCPPFALAALTQKQITLPATITDAGQPISDVVTVQGDGIVRRAVVRIAPPQPDLLPFAIGGAAVLIAGAAAAWAAQRSRASRRRWESRIAAHGALGAAQETTIGEVKFAAPPVGVTARLDAGETRIEGPIPAKEIS